MKPYFLFLPIPVLVLMSCGSEPARRTAQPKTPPVAVQTGKLRVGSEPLNLTTASGAHLLIVRAKTGTGVLIFERVVQKAM